MNILLVEDEDLVAERIVRLSKDVLGNRLVSIKSKSSLEDAMDYIASQPIDVLLLDLNLNGRDGFQLLKQAVSSTFHTIVISANIDKAISAFEYGVLDFVGKPCTKERLEKAFSKVDEAWKYSNHTKFLSVRKKDELVMLEVENIKYIQGSGVYTEIHMDDDRVELHNKTLSRLEDILPENFSRIHKSYIVNMRKVKSLRNHGEHKHDIVLFSGDALPVSRPMYKKLKGL